MGEWLRVAFMPSAMVRSERGGHGGGRGRGRGRVFGRGNGGTKDSDEMYDSLNEDKDKEEDMVVEKDENGMAAEKQEIAKQLGDQFISPLALQEKKRPRRSEGEKEVNDESTIARSVLSFEESDRAQ